MAKKKNPAAVELGRLGGKVGGKAKVKKGLATLTPEQRSAIAAKGGTARAKKAKKAKEAS